MRWWPPPWACSRLSPQPSFTTCLGNAIREIGARLEDFSLEFLNLTERNFEE